MVRGVAAIPLDESEVVSSFGKGGCHSEIIGQPVVFWHGARPA